MHDLYRKHPRLPKPMLTGVSLVNNEFNEWREDDFGLCFEPGGELLEREEGNTGAVEGKQESWVLGERFEEKSGLVIRARARNAVNESDLRTTAGIQISGG